MKQRLAAALTVVGIGLLAVTQLSGATPQRSIPEAPDIDVQGITESVLQPMRSLSYDAPQRVWLPPEDPMELVPTDHALLLEWLDRNGGFTERDIEAVCGMVQNEGGNCGSLERRKLVWCVLDRLSHPQTAWCGDTLYEQIAYPGQFREWYVTAPYTEETRADVENVLTRWILKYVSGFDSIERELPEGYVWYTGDLVSHNYFRNVY